MSGHELFHKPAGVFTRWANAENPRAEKGAAAQAWKGRKGAPCRPNLGPGESHVLAEAQGSGVVRRLWITFETRDNPEMLRALRLECFWDGEATPAVSVPLGDFFCCNTGKLVPMENAFFSNPEGRSFNCVLPMPFRTGMKITVTNESATVTEGQLFYQVDFTQGDQLGPEALYFHALYRRERATTPMVDYTILPLIQGQGRYLGASFGVTVNPRMKGTWWGEGELKCWIDGDGTYPTLAGTGVEDYIGTGWGQGVFAHQWQGCLEADEEAGRYAFYRFHGPDPVWFDTDIRVCIQQIGNAPPAGIASMLDQGLDVWQNGLGVRLDRTMPGAIFERFDDDWSSVAYFYLSSPSFRVTMLS
ncbi:MAG: glycoside hydrolase family 172 protein [Spirochaetales bacterium]